LIKNTNNTLVLINYAVVFHAFLIKC